MVALQLEARGICDPRVLAAMLEVPRHEFVDAAVIDQAYEDRALPASEGQTISQPWIVARMLELAQLAPGQRVLEVGAGSGYQSALLARLVARVVAIERIEALASAARERLVRLGVCNVDLHCGDGTRGWRVESPYARVLAAAAAPHVPRELLEQLEDGGLLVMPVGGPGLQRLETWRRGRAGYTRERHGECRFVPLIGAGAWPEEPRRN